MQGVEQLSWSPDLQRDLNNLTAQRRRAILTIISDEARGIALTRRLKTSFSCRWCGWQAQPQIGPTPRRKAALAEHEESCLRALARDPGTDEAIEPPRPWQFVANQSTYYSKWINNPAFADCLARARREFTNQVLSEAGMILKHATPGAARELARQVEGGDKDFDRRSAAIAILDRADLTTADKSYDPVKDWLDALRSEDSPQQGGDGESK